MPKVKPIVTAEQSKAAVIGYLEGKTNTEIAIETGIKLGILSSLWSQLRAAGVNLPPRTKADRLALSERGRNTAIGTPRMHRGGRRKRVELPLEY